MGKAVISAYRGFTAATIKSRATVPDQADMTVVGTTVECANVDIIKIRNALGISALDFVSQHQSANVNPWSGFGPTKRTISSQAIVNSEEAPRGLFEFAGYNHTAAAPAWFSKSAAEADIWVNSGSTATFVASVKIGEVRYKEELSIEGVVLAIYNSASNLVAYDIVDIDDLTDGVDFTAELSNCTAQETYTGKVYMVNDISSFNGTQVVCKVPNVDDYSVTVKIRTASDSVNGMTGWTVSGFGHNLTDGTVGFSDAYINTDFSAIEIVAYLTTDALGSYDPIVIYSGAYTSGTHLGTLAADFGSNFSAYGYHFTIVVNESA